MAKEHSNTRGFVAPPKGWSLVSRESVERMAHILGPSSASAKAIVESENYLNPVFFRAGNLVIVTSSENVEVGA